MSSAPRVADVDLVLRRADLVVVVLDRDAHRLERADRVAADARWPRPSSSARSSRPRRASPCPCSSLNRKYSSLGADVERVEAHRLHALERAPQHVARVAVVRLAVGRDDVADHPATGLARPGRTRKVSGSGIATMSDSSIALKPVIDEPSKPIPSSSAPSTSRGRDREALQVPLEIREPEQHELDASRLRSAPAPRTRLPGSLVALGADSTAAINSSFRKTKAPGAGVAPEATSPHD